MESNDDKLWNEYNKETVGLPCDSAESDGTGFDSAAISRCSSISSMSADTARVMAAPASFASRPRPDCKRALDCMVTSTCTQPKVSHCCLSPCGDLSLGSEDNEIGTSLVGDSGLSTLDHASAVAGGEEDLVSMLRSLRALEDELRPSADYMLAHSCERQRQFIDEGMRCTAVSWLMEVSCESVSHEETLYLAISLLDRFLSATSGVPRDVLQLLSVACLLIAAKHEEEMHPSVPHLTRMADHCFKEADLLQMERTVLTSLEFRINMPTAHTFWSVYQLGHVMHSSSASMSNYLMELAQLEYSFLQFEPSRLAAAALLVAERHTGTPDSTANMGQYISGVTGYSVSCLQECVVGLLRLHGHSIDAALHDLESPFLPVNEKYACEEWFSSSLVDPRGHGQPGNAIAV